MSYDNDEDLNFLRKLKSEELAFLVQFLTRNTDGSKRTYSVTGNSTEYNNYFPNHHLYWKYIAEDIQRFGANTFVTAVRGHGVAVCPFKRNAYMNSLEIAAN